MTALLEVEDLEVRFHTQDGIVHAVNGISYTINQGETLVEGLQMVQQAVEGSSSILLRASQPPSIRSRRIPKTDMMRELSHTMNAVPEATVSVMSELTYPRPDPTPIVSSTGTTNRRFSIRLPGWLISSPNRSSEPACPR